MAVAVVSRVADGTSLGLVESVVACRSLVAGLNRLMVHSRSVTNICHNRDWEYDFHVTQHSRPT